MGCRPAPEALRRAWEAVLEAEGMPSEPRRGSEDMYGDPHAAMATIPSTQVEGRVWSSAPERTEVETIDSLMIWLPLADQYVVTETRRGVSQRELGRVLEIKQPSVAARLRKAEQRLRALHAAHERHSLPDDHHHLRALAGPFHATEDIELVIYWTESWCLTAAAEAMGWPQTRAWTRSQGVLASQQPELAGVVGLLRVVHRLYSLRRSR